MFHLYFSWNNRSGNCYYDLSSGKYTPLPTVNTHDLSIQIRYRNNIKCEKKQELISKQYLNEEPEMLRMLKSGHNQPVLAIKGRTW